MIYRMVLASLMFVSLFQIDAAFAQFDRFASYLNTTKLIYKPQRNYSGIDYTGNFFPDYPDGTFGLSFIFYSLKYDKNDIVIGLAPCPIIEEDKNSLTYRLFPSDTNKNWLVDLKVEADTSDNKIIYYNKKQLSAINADNAALYQLKMKQVFLGKYTACKVLIIHKEHISDAQIFYFYNDNSKAIVNKQIKATYGILKFK